MKMQDASLTKKPLKPFRPGDIVFLKSGGPPMTIRDVSEESIACDWMDGSKAQKKEFHVSQLRHDTSPDEIRAELAKRLDKMRKQRAQADE